MKKLFKRISCILIALATAFCTLTTVGIITSSAEAGTSTLISRFSKEPSYGGAYYDGDLFYIATTDIEAFEALREKLSSNENYAGSTLSNTIFVEVKYTYTELSDIIYNIRKTQEELGVIVEHSYTDVKINMAVIGLLNPEKDAESKLRESLNFTNIIVEPIYREFIEVGDNWSKTVAITETKIKYDADGNLYTGWTKTTSGKQYYYINGVRLTGVHKFNSGARYVFDENGVYIGKLTDDDEYSFISDNGYKINIDDGEITFKVKINPKDGKTDWDYSGGPYFSLSVYKEGKWIEIPYAIGAFDSYALGCSRDGNNELIMTFTQKLSSYYCEFAPGVYRVKANLNNGDRDENDVSIWQELRCEFNFV